MSQLEVADDTTDQTDRDAQFLAGVVQDNDTRNSRGITSPDLAVCLEMSALCKWGSTYKVSRFNRSLRRLEEMPEVVKRGDRYFWHDSSALKRMDEAGVRVCARRTCTQDISHMRANAQFCGRRCKLLASRDQTGE